MTRYDVVIVGGGHAGVQVAVGLVQNGYKGSIALLSAEEALPYERPPLSKAYLAGSVQPESFQFRDSDYWASSAIDLLTSHEVIEVDADAKKVVASNGVTIEFGTLVWAAGGTARSLLCPGNDFRGVHAVRDIRGVDALRESIADAKKVLIVGGGYIGLESAAALRKLGLDVTLLEFTDRLLARVTGPEVSAFYRSLQEANGVEIRLETSVSEILPNQTGSGVGGVLLSDGSTLGGDAVLVGVGLVPNVSALERAGATVQNGLVTDELGRTNLNDVFAIGDCSYHPSSYHETGMLRLESVQNAVQQARSVVATLTGNVASSDPVPWFWSNQYDVRLKTAGILTGYEEEIVRGDSTSKSFSVLYLKGGKLCAIDTINSPRDFANGKALIQAQSFVDRVAASDTDLPLSEALLAHM